MTSSKSQDISLTRTAPGHRSTMSTSTAAAYPRQMHPRTHSHSLSMGSINLAHRVSRRKSMTATNKDAVMAAMAGNTSAEAGSFAARRASKSGSGSKAAPAFPASLPSGSGFAQSSYEPKSGSAIVDEPSLETLPENEKGNGKARVRRASEGSRLGKGEGKRASGAELRCDKCGKGYKHSSCLTKHLWEHTPEWQFTSKLLISKHQQVQLLEAASVLVAMNKDGPSAIESDDSASPAASGSSDPHDDEMSSTETTPPPDHQRQPEFGHAKRYSENSSIYSHSYQSSVFSESAPTSRAYMSHYRQWSTDGRPTTSGTSVTGSYREDSEQTELTAAVGLLSCSYGTPKSGPVMLPADVPPVPPLPAQFLGQKAEHLSGGSGMTLTGPSANYSCIRGNRDGDVDMEDDVFDRPQILRGRSDDDDEGMFGKMEE